MTPNELADAVEKHQIKGNRWTGNSASWLIVALLRAGMVDAAIKAFKKNEIKMLPDLESCKLLRLHLRPDMVLQETAT